MTPVNRPNTAGPSHRPPSSSTDSQSTHPLQSCGDAPAASSRAPAAGQRSVDAQNLISQLQRQEPSAHRQPLSREHLEHALTAWVQNDRGNLRDRSKAQRMILECFDDRAASLNLSGLNLRSLPEQIGHLTWIKSLYLSHTPLTRLPDAIGNLTQLELLSVSNTSLNALPNAFGNLTRLSSLDMSHTPLIRLPDFIGNLAQLGGLYMHNTLLNALPDSIGNLTRLRSLDMSNTQLSALPDSIGNLTQLRSLDVSNTQLSALPDAIGNLTQLNSLYVYNTQLSALPDAIGYLTQLRALYVNNAQLSALPDSVGNLTQLRTLYAYNNQLTHLPDAIGNLTRLGSLDVSDNHLGTLPDSIGNLTWLSTLNLARNQMTQPPHGIFRLPQITDINLEQNPLSPRAIDALFRRTAGPMIHFTIHEATAGQQQEADFEQVLRRYCNRIEPDHLANLQDTENADAFRRLLAGLANTAEAGRPGFRQRVATVIETLAAAGSADLRANCFFQAQQGLQACGDRVAITFSDIEVACKVHRIVQAGGDSKQVADLFRGLFRMKALEAFARNDIARRRSVDEIEVFLAYQVGLKDELQLPCETEAMLYPIVSGVNRQRLDHAKAHVLAAENADNGAALVEFALAHTSWKDYIERNPSFQETTKGTKEASEIAMNDLFNRRKSMSSNDYLNESDRITAERNTRLNTLLREQTRKMLVSGSRIAELARQAISLVDDLIGG